MLYRAAKNFEDPQALLDNFFQRLEALQQRTVNGQERLLQQKQDRLALLAGRLNALSPLAVLSRGYSVATDIKGTALKSAKNVRVGDAVFIKLYEGCLEAEITEVKQ